MPRSGTCLRRRRCRSGFFGHDYAPARENSFGQDAKEVESARVYGAGRAHSSRIVIFLVVMMMVMMSSEQWQYSSQPFGLSS